MRKMKRRSKRVRGKGEMKGQRRKIGIGARETAVKGKARKEAIKIKPGSDRDRVV